MVHEQVIFQSGEEGKNKEKSRDNNSTEEGNTLIGETYSNF